MIEYILFILGIILLIKGADYLVEGSSSLAKKLGVSTLVIGLTIVAFGTSTPELVVNILAALKGSGDVAFGNILGSNMANILLILGITAIITNLKVQHSTTWKEVPFSFLAAAVLFIFSMMTYLDGAAKNILLRADGIILLLFFSVFLYYVFELSKTHKSEFDEKKIAAKDLRWSVMILMILGGLVALYFGGKWTVDGAVFIARQFGLSEFLISATVVAIGTSLPELITSIAAARKHDVDMAVGNIVGSNIFNIFWILGITSTIRPIAFPLFSQIDILLVLIATFLLFLFLYTGRKHELERWQGIIFVLLYIAYIVYLILRG